MTPYESVLSAMADAVTRRAAKRVVKRLRAHPPQHSGDDSGLVNVWEEVCVQVQGEESIFWALYQEFVDDAVELECDNMTALEKQAVWLQTDAGFEWACDVAEDLHEIPVIQDDICEYVRSEVYGAAANEKSRRVQNYLG